MGGDSCSQEAGLDLLQQMELILEQDSLIDEVGFTHPSHFASLSEESSGSLQPQVDVVQATNESLDKNRLESNELRYDKSVFWYSNHKLAISTEVLPQLYHAALHAYTDARGSYKLISENVECFDNAANGAHFDHFLGNEILRHSRALLILNYDFTSAWNSRKLILSRKHESSLFMDEFQLSALILSYAPKSENAWSHRRWVIKMIAESQNLQEIVGKESDLVEKIAEKTKMNYRAWNHRCWLLLHMTMSQVLDELNKSKKWAELHVADNCCFHYRRRLMRRLLEDNFVKQDGAATFNFKIDVYTVWTEELQWNELLIQRYIGREALWVHRRFLSQCWIKYFAINQQVFIPRLEADHRVSSALDEFLGEETKLVRTCLHNPPDELVDNVAQAQHAASYILWISKQIPLHQESKLQEWLKALADVKAILTKTCPEKMLLWKRLLN